MVFFTYFFTLIQSGIEDAEQGAEYEDSAMQIALSVDQQTGIEAYGEAAIDLSAEIFAIIEIEAEEVTSGAWADFIYQSERVQPGCCHASEEGEPIEVEATIGWSDYFYVPEESHPGCCGQETEEAEIPEIEAEVGWKKYANIIAEQG